MEDYKNNKSEEKAYLEYTIDVLKHLIKTEEAKLEGRKRELVASRKDMWENSVHFSDDFERLTEVSQHLQQVQSRTSDYANAKKNIDKYGRMMNSPYFGRFDFTESGCGEAEKIYIGKGNVTDPNNGTIVIYDWRAPISGMYYRFEPGKACYSAPFGEISGEMRLKRQYKIVKSQLKYFFDCSIQISDEMLQEVLSRNSSPKMRSIIETIQKEQDIVIRDTDSDLLIVQGAAGSGKTSIALHRVAFLLYEGMASRLNSNNILILSPNDAFCDYIGHVLPELGEENVKTSTMEGIVKGCLKDESLKNSLCTSEGRGKQLEACITGRGSIDGETVSRWVQFKGSKALSTIIDRYLSLFERRFINFEDVYYHGRLIAGRHELKAMFLNNKTGISMANRLARIESRILDRIVDLRKERLKSLEALVQKSDGHEFEVKAFARQLLMKDSHAFVQKLKRFTELDIVSMYKGLFRDRMLFNRLSKDLTLPGDISDIIRHTCKALNSKCPYYEDLTAMAYMKLRAFGADTNDDIRQVIIDEIQDYYPIQLAIMKDLYGRARFTVVGDICQTIERGVDLSIYDVIPELLQKKKTLQIILKRSYRSSYEINEFAKRFIGKDMDSVSFPRHEAVPEVQSGGTKEELSKILLEKIHIYKKEGFESVAVLCKTMKQTEELYNRIKGLTKVRIENGNGEEKGTGCRVMPVYAAKGLEFDAVLVYGVDDANYSTELDRRILYVACTRALHRLGLLYTGKISRFLEELT